MLGKSRFIWIGIYYRVASPLKISEARVSYKVKIKSPQCTMGYIPKQKFGKKKWGFLQKTVDNGKVRF